MTSLKNSGVFSVEGFCRSSNKRCTSYSNHVGTKNSTTHNSEEKKRPVVFGEHLIVEYVRLKEIVTEHLCYLKCLKNSLLSTHHKKHSHLMAVE